MTGASPASSRIKTSAGETVVVAVGLALGWIWLVAGTHLHEMMVGAGAVVLATLFLRAVQESSKNTLRLAWKDVLQGSRIPWYMVCDTWVVTLLLLRDVLRLRPAGSYYRVCGFKCSKGDPVLVGRGVLATIYMTATPNTIFVGIDPESSRMLFHQLERARVPEMARALGAQP